MLWRATKARALSPCTPRDCPIHPHSWKRWRYAYPQRAFPYAELVTENARRDRQEREYELLDTGVFAESRYVDVTVDYAKAAPDDYTLLIHHNGMATAPSRCTASCPSTR